MTVRDSNFFTPFVPIVQSTQIFKRPVPLFGIDFLARVYKYGMKWNLNMESNGIKMEWNGTYWIKGRVNTYTESGMKWNELE